MNALAGGGSFVSLPALISVGVPSVAANATSTLALFPGGMASSWVYRDGVRSVCGVNVVPIAIVTVMGGVAGSILLLLTPSRIFDGLLPWLLLVATLMLTAGPRLSARFQTQARPSVLAFATVQFFLGLYGGYFGGAVGLMMLAAWSALGGGDIKSLNPTRMVMVTAANAVAVVVFVLAGANCMAGVHSHDDWSRYRRVDRSAYRTKAAIIGRSGANPRGRLFNDRGVLFTSLPLSGGPPLRLSVNNFLVL